MTKKPLFGIDTKQSAARVEKQVLKEIRTQRKKRGFVILPTVIIVTAMALFLAFQVLPNLQSDTQVPSKYQVPSTVLDDELMIQVGPLIENDIFLNNTNITPEQEFKKDYKVLSYRYLANKLEGEKVEFELSQHWIEFFRVNFGEDIYAWGSGSTENNASQDYVEDQYRIVFNAKNITEANLRAALDEVYFTVRYENEKGEVFEDKFRLGAYLDFAE